MEVASQNEHERLCMGCMRLRGGEEACVACGFDEGLPLDLPIALPPRTVLANQYLVGRVLGHGGFGITYLGWDLNLNIKLAIKEYFPNVLVTREPDRVTVSALGTKARQNFQAGLDRFLAEARILARFNEHPGIVSVLSFFRAHNTGYLVMSYVEGITLKAHLEQQNGALPYRTAAKVLLPVMDALAEVHAAGILHRDISPDNIYITHGGVVKLLDFGAAREVIEGSERSVSVILKQGYAPPEQYISRGEQGPWTDVYALGATLFRAIFGVSPPESLTRISRDTLLFPASPHEPIPTALSRVIARALEPQHSKRFQTVAEFREALLSAAGLSEPPSPTTPTRIGSVRSWVTPKTGSTAAVVLLIALLTMFFRGGSVDERLIGEYRIEATQFDPNGIHRLTIADDGSFTFSIGERIVGALETSGNRWVWNLEGGGERSGEFEFTNPSKFSVRGPLGTADSAHSWELVATQTAPRSVASLVGRWHQPFRFLGFLGERTLTVEPSGRTTLELRLDATGKVQASKGKWEILNDKDTVVDSGSYDSDGGGTLQFVGRESSFLLHPKQTTH